MRVHILGAAGRTGRALTLQALARGYDVTALVRSVQRAQLPEHPRLSCVEADVRDAASIVRALGAGAVVLSGLGVSKDDGSGARGVLSIGARAVLDAAPQRVLWLGAYGTGASAAAAGWAVRAVLSLMGPRLVDKVRADTAVLGAGGTVFHAGPLSDDVIGAARKTVAVQDAPRRFFPARVSRATVAAAMLDELDARRFVGAVAVPLQA